MIIRILPVAILHLLSVGAHPHHVLPRRRVRIATAEEVTAPQYWIGLPNGDDPLGERQQVALPIVESGPVDPGYLVVLRVRIVVAALRTRDLVAVSDHRRALGERQ